MSETDDLVRRSLHRVASDITPDVSGALSEVQRRRERARRLGRRAAVISVAALVALLVGVTSLSHHAARQQRPIGPAHHAPTQPFQILRTLTPRSLGLQGVLRVAVSPAGYLVVTDQSQRVAEVTPSGRVIRAWGTAGTGPGELRLQSGSVAVGTDGTIYVADSGNSRVQVFSATGRFVTALGSYGTGPGQMIKPADLAADPQGNVYVADDEASTLTKFSPTGAQVWRLDQADTHNGDLVGHFHFVGLNARHDLVVANDDAGRVVWVSPRGTEVAHFGSGESSYRSGGAAKAVGEFPHGACGASTDRAGRLYVVSCQDPSAPQHDIEIFDSGHHLIGKATGSPLATAPVFLPDGTAVFVSHSGDIVEARVLSPRG